MFLTKTLDFLSFFVVHTFFWREKLSSVIWRLFFEFWHFSIFKSLPAFAGRFPKEFFFDFLFLVRKKFFDFSFWRLFRKPFTKREFFWIHCLDFLKDVALKKELKISFFFFFWCQNFKGHFDVRVESRVFRVLTCTNVGSFLVFCFPFCMKFLTKGVFLSRKLEDLKIIRFKNEKSDLCFHVFDFLIKFIFVCVFSFIFVISFVISITRKVSLWR